MKAFVIAGPAKIGNCFGVFGKVVPDGKFAVCTRGEYANGGHGPSQAGPQKLYDTRDEAQRVALVYDEDLMPDEIARLAAALPDDWQELTSARP